MIPEEDLHIQVYRVPPDQNWAGAHRPLVWIRHIPTGIAAQVDEEASALQNKALCLAKLESLITQDAQIARLTAVVEVAKPLYRYLKLSDNPLASALGAALKALDGGDRG